MTEKSNKHEEVDVEKGILAEFPIPSVAEWKSAAEDLLKGAPFDKKMYTRTVEGIELSPIYTREGTAHLPHLSLGPGDVGSPRGSRAQGYLETTWDYLQEITEGDPSAYNKILLEQLNRGQNAVVLTLDVASAECKNPSESKVGEVGGCGLSLSQLSDWNAALKNVHAEAVSIQLYPGFASVPMALYLRAWAEGQDADCHQWTGCVHSDPIGSWALRGSLPLPWRQSMDLLAQSYRVLDKALPKFDCMGVSGLPYHGAGASAVDELGITLAVGLQYLRELQERGFGVEEVASKMVFTYSLGSNFFMDLAKLRAARITWARILQTIGVENPPSPRMHGRTAFYNKTVYDPYVNMLRTTTEAFCGVLGGLDGINVGPFDECIRTPDTFSRRIARNTHIILGEECELRRVVDPAGGSWYLESLTDEVCSASWKIFQKIETAGGMVAALRSGEIHAICQASQVESAKRLHQRRSSLIGTNVYANTTEQPLSVNLPAYEKLYSKRCAEVSATEPKSVNGKSIESLLKTVKEGATLADLRKILALEKPIHEESFVALPVCRWAEDYENLRKAAVDFAKSNGHPPRIFLVTLGALRDHKIRADFTRGFFESGGFEVLYVDGFDQPDEVLKSLGESSASVAIVCGTDEQYGQNFSSFAKEIKARFPEVRLLLAGHPGDNEADYRAAGMDDFLWMRSNHYETNRDLLLASGVQISSRNKAN